MRIQDDLELVSGAISVTGACTIACKHCYSESGPKITTTHSLETLKHIVEVLRGRGVRQIFVGGGEPFLHPDLHMLVEYMFSIDVLPSVSSNGHCITKGRMQALYDAGMRYNMAISLDGPNDQINGLIRGPKSFYSTLMGMYELAEFGKILWGVNYVCCQQNLGYALDTAMLASRMGASYFNCIKFTPSGRGARHAVEMAVSDEEYEREALTVANQFQPLGEYYNEIFVFDVRNDTPGSTNRRMVDCAASYFSDFPYANPLGISINHNGDVALAPPNIPLGNIRRDELTCILDKINTNSVREAYERWLEGQWVGIHPAKSEVWQPKVSKMIRTVASVS
jgi:MoaA/NifB/PqqE/SkfB family radical SAM enzyme